MKKNIEKLKVKIALERSYFVRQIHVRVERPAQSNSQPHMHTALHENVESWTALIFRNVRFDDFRPKIRAQSFKI